MGSVFVNLWVECTHESNDGFWTRIEKKENKNERAMFICVLVAMLAFVMFVLFVALSLLTGEILSFIAFVVSVVFLVVVSKRTHEKDLTKRIVEQREVAISRVAVFLDKSGLAPCVIPFVYKTVNDYCQMIRDDYKTFSDRAFNVCIIGVIGILFATFLNACMQGDTFLTIISVVLSLFAFGGFGFVLASWEVFNYLRKPSFLQTMEMIKALECYMAYDNNLISAVFAK